MKIRKWIMLIIFICSVNVATLAAVNTQQYESQQETKYESRKKLGIIVVAYLGVQGIIWYLWFLRLNRLVLKRYDRYDIPNFPKSETNMPNVSNDP